MRVPWMFSKKCLHGYLNWLHTTWFWYGDPFNMIRFQCFWSFRLVKSLFSGLQMHVEGEVLELAVPVLKHIRNLPSLTLQQMMQLKPKPKFKSVPSWSSCLFHSHVLDVQYPSRPAGTLWRPQADVRAPEPHQSVAQPVSTATWKEWLESTREAQSKSCPRRLELRELGLRMVLPLLSVPFGHVHRHCCTCLSFSHSYPCGCI